MRRIAFAIFLALASASPAASALGADFGADRYVAWAEAYWQPQGGTPACGAPAFAWRTEAEAQTESGLSDVMVANANPATCEVHLVRPNWWAYTDTGRCRVIFHELGHLYGHQHSEGGIMGPNSGLIDFPACDRPLAAANHRAAVRRRETSRRARRGV